MIYNVEINKFPFSKKSSLVLFDTSYTLPLGLFVDANFFPRCTNKPPFYVSYIKNDNADRVYFGVRDNEDNLIFDIVFNKKYNALQNYIVGEGLMYNGMHCGYCLCTKDFKDFIQHIPDINNLQKDSLMFSGSVIRPIVSDVAKNGVLRYNGKIVDNIQWGDNIDKGTIVPSIIDVDDDNTETPIKTIIFNGETLTGENIHITAGKNSLIRVKNKSEIVIGSILDL